MDIEEKVTNKDLLKWARVFKAKTMEELEELSENDEVFSGVLETVQKFSDDEKIREQCRAREEYVRIISSQYQGGYKEGKAEEHKKTVKETERADAEAERADAEAQRADSEAERADAEAERADTEAQRADKAEKERNELKEINEALEKQLEFYKKTKTEQ